MQYGYVFDDLEFEDGYDMKDHPPIWMKKITDKGTAGEEFLKWLNKDFDIKKKVSSTRVANYRENLSLYKGIHFKSQTNKNVDFRRDGTGYIPIICI